MKVSQKEVNILYPYSQGNKLYNKFYMDRDTFLILVYADKNKTHIV